MTKIRNMIVLLGLLILMVAGARYMTETAVAQTMQPRAYIPLIMKSGEKPIGDPFQGEGTYYLEADGSGNCLYPATPDDLMVAAVNQTQYGTADLCGAFVRVQGRQGSVLVRIVDRCPECAYGDLDLSPQAFALIDNISYGRVPISWQVVSPNIEGPIRFEFKEKNQWWTAVQVRNHRNPIIKFEYLTSGGTYKTIPRTSYNYFLESSGMGPGPYTFRVTDVLGNVIVSSGIPLSNPGTEIDGSGQFPQP